MTIECVTPGIDNNNNNSGGNVLERKGRVLSASVSVCAKCT